MLVSVSETWSSLIFLISLWIQLTTGSNDEHSNK